MKRVFLTFFLRAIVTVFIACLLMSALVSRWPAQTPSDGEAIGTFEKLFLPWLRWLGGGHDNNGSETFQEIFLPCLRSICLIAIALFFSVVFTAFSIRLPRGMFKAGIKRLFFCFAVAPAIFWGYVLDKIFVRSKIAVALSLAGVMTFCVFYLLMRAPSEKGRLRLNSHFHQSALLLVAFSGSWVLLFFNRSLLKYCLAGFILGVGDGLLNETVKNAELEVEDLQRQNYIRQAKSMGEEVWLVSRVDFWVRFWRVLVSKIPTLISSSVIIEFVFRLDGLGSLIFHATAPSRAPSLLFSILVCIVIGLSVLNFIYSIVCAIFDPRLREN